MLVPLLWVLYLPVRKPRAAEVASWSWSGCVLFTEAQCRQVLSDRLRGQHLPPHVWALPDTQKKLGIWANGK